MENRNPINNLLHSKLVLHGKLVRLAAENRDAAPRAFAAWARDSEYMRLLTSEPPVLWSEQKIRKWIDEQVEKDSPDAYYFAIHRLEDDRPIGAIGLDGILWNQREAWVGVGIGDRESWGKGYGTDAMRVILRFAFNELNLHRVALNVFEYNPRAIRSYEKAGFVHEGRVRSYLHRAGRRWDLVFMGILQTEFKDTE